MSPHSSLLATAAPAIGCHSLIPVWSSAAEIQSVPRTGRFMCGSGEDCDIRILLKGVASYHCLIDANNEFITVRPAPGASIWLNDVPVTGTERVNSGDVFAIGPAMFRFQAATADLPASGTFPLSEQQSTNSDADIAAHIARLERRLEAAEAGHLEAVLPLMSALTNQTLTNRVVAETSTDVATGGSEDVSQPSNSDGDCEQAGVDAKRLHNLELKLHRQSQSLEDCSRRIEEQESQLQHEQTEFEQSVAEFEQRVADVSESAAAAQKNEVQRSQEELAARQQQLEQRTSEIDARQEKQTHREEQLATAANEVESQAETLQTDRRQLLEKEHTLQKEVDSECERLTVLENSLAERDSQLTARETEVSEARLNVDERQTAELKSSFEQITTLESGLKERDVQLAALESETAAARMGVSERQTELESTLEQVTELESSLVERDAQLAAQESSLAERDTQLAALESSLAERDAQLPVQEREISAAIENDRQRHSEELEILAAEVAERSDAVQKEAHDLAGQAERLCEREASGAADHLSKEQDIAAHEQRLTERESLLAERDSALAEQQRQIEALEEQRNERDKERAEEFEIAQEESRAQAADSVNAAEAALGTRAEELDAREVELGVRYDETAARVVQLKRLAKANSIPPPSATDSASADEELIAELEDAHRRSTVLESERDELNTALVELREAFQSLHDEWVMRQKADAEIEALGNSEQQHTQQSLTNPSDELLQLQTRLSVRDEDVAELEQKLLEVVSNFEEERSEWQSSVSQLTAVPDRHDADPSKLAEYEAIICELRDQLDTALNAPGTTGSDRQLGDNADSSVVDDLQRDLAVKDELLTELKVQLGGAAATRRDEEHIKLQHAELDDRIAVLDQREADSCERQRRIENTEEDIEAQRRQLLEARQQLELARAELQVTANAQPQSLHDPQTAMPSESLIDTACTDLVDTQDGDARSTIRSELAEMFGLGGNEVVTSSAAEDLMPTKVDHYAPESSDEVSLSFSSAENVLLEACGDEVAEEEKAEEETEEKTSDQFVADYMEQLLARNRQKAGGTLPEELTSESSSSASKDESAAEPQRPQTKSFIDSYMAGDYDNETSESESESAAAVDRSADAALLSDTKNTNVDRPKIDLAALRNDMNSFRALSTQSIENALAVHAQRKERSGIAARSTIFLVLAVICVFMIAAVLTNIIPSGAFVWLSVAATIVSGIDLVAKIFSVKSKVKKTADNLAPRGPASVSQSASSGQVISPELLEALPLSAEETSDAHGAPGQKRADQFGDPNVESANLAELGEKRDLAALEATEEDQYFEL